MKSMVKTPANPYKYTEEFINNLADKLVLWIQNPDNFWLGTFAAENGFHRQRLPDFAAINKKFAEALEIAKQYQENRLITGAVVKKFDTYMANSALKNACGWRDETHIKQEIDMSVNEFKSDLSDRLKALKAVN